MRYSLVIFDLDGTLAHSLPWFRRNVNSVAHRFAFRRIDDENIEPLRRAGSREILRRLNVPLWKLPAIARHMRQLKAAHMTDIPLFPGVDTMLRALTDSGIRLALVSSDHESNARRQLGHSNAARFFHFECGASFFGKAAKFRLVLKRAGVPAADAVAFGDELRDIEAAHAAGIACAAVTWGYAAPEALRAHAQDFVFDRMEEVVCELTRAP